MMNRVEQTDYTNLSSLHLLAERIMSFSDEQKIWFSAFVMDSGLMKPTGFSAWLMWKLITRTAQLKKINRVIFYVILCRKSKHSHRMALDTADQTCAWITSGKDMTCDKSAGGFNAEEIKQVDEFVRAVRMIR